MNEAPIKTRPLFWTLCDAQDLTAGAEGISVISAKTQYAAIWTLICTSAGQDLVIEPNGRIVDASRPEPGSDLEQFVTAVTNGLGWDGVK